MIPEICTSVITYSAPFLPLSPSSPRTNGAAERGREVQGLDSEGKERFGEGERWSYWKNLEEKYGG